MDSPERQPSHRITEDGGRVTIHDLELFVGHIDGFDDDDSEIKDLDEKKIFEIIEKTERHMAAGSSPKLVLMHQDENGNSPTESIGDIVKIHSKPITINCSEGESYEGAGIVGDVEMSKEDFQKYLASNRYPRRSAEIWEDGHCLDEKLQQDRYVTQSLHAREPRRYFTDPQPSIWFLQAAATLIYQAGRTKKRNTICQTQILF